MKPISGLSKEQKKTEECLKNESQNTKTCVLLKPLFRLIYQPVLVIERIAIQKISYQPMQEAQETTSNHNETGLDCSGQGECQPNIENSDGDKMQQYLVKANRQKKVCSYRQSRGTRLSIEKKSKQ